MIIYCSLHNTGTNYVYIAGMESNFEITNPSFVTTQGVPYDLQSIMHYGAYAFSRNRRPTIEPVNNGINLNALGQRNGLSELDLRHVVALYCEGVCMRNYDVNLLIPNHLISLFFPNVQTLT